MSGGRGSRGHPSQGGPAFPLRPFCAGRIGRELINQVGPVVVFPKPLHQGLGELSRLTVGRVPFSLHRKAPSFTLSGKERLRRGLLQVNLSEVEAGVRTSSVLHPGRLRSSASTSCSSPASQPWPKGLDWPAPSALSGAHLCPCPQPRAPRQVNHPVVGVAASSGGKEERNNLRVSSAPLSTNLKTIINCQKQVGMTHILRAGVVLYHGATEFPHCATVGGG